MKDETEVEMTIKKNGRWYRFVKCEDSPCFECAKCCFYRQCINAEDGSTCIIGDASIMGDVVGYFERFRPTSELVRIGVRLLKRASMMYHDTEFLCLAGVGNDNEIKFASYKFKREAYHPELLALIDRLNALGLIV